MGRLEAVAPRAAITLPSPGLSSLAGPYRRARVLDVIKMGSSFNNPNTPLAATMAEMLEQQIELGITALQIIRQYIPDTPIARETVEDARKEVERINAARLQRELDAEKEPREQEEQ